MARHPGAPERREFFDAAGGEVFRTASMEGHEVTMGTLPVPDGTVRVLVMVVMPDVGPYGVHVVLSADQVRRMGEQLVRAAGR